MQTRIGRTSQRGSCACLAFLTDLKDVIVTNEKDRGRNSEYKAKGGLNLSGILWQQRSP